MMESKVYEVTAKSVMIGRKPRANDGEFKTLSVSFFDVNNPHKTGEFPTKVLEFPNMEKVRILGLNMSYYLEGNDIVINDLKGIKIQVSGSKALITGDQKFIENRDI
ncbi:hypothetical protein HN419_07130 [Candidatus Woesearchaeota archaeon]|jgi:hypothetical protein|nr:hypothetical protein [Candidatus Woesearchaeota archaeon]MBT3538265.1 hypothetical protein [Candidatus Woesearchaeota archaeon]MBT4697169.1 hypothetical protein [Candidatus Woesearchaeota archaeon]MBT4717431.1 hypothetical protein [Candidatus Woesearchaeota archaeon]MBT7105934.1 hypothetical protein [Candidatus Woesearchaeota archaeon]